MNLLGKPTDQATTAVQQDTTSLAPELPFELNPARQLLERYSGIPPEDINAHIRQIKDKALSVFPYGFISSFSFLDLTSLQDPLFQTVTKLLKAPGSTETFLDVGCCFGTVLRYLLAEGVSSERLFGTDLRSGFIDLGYELFRDRETKARFITGDMLREDDVRLDELNGKIDIIYAAAFFHLFERADQVKAAKRMVGFLRSGNSEAMIFGWNGGPKIVGWEKYMLSIESWREVWNEVGETTGTSWRTEVDLQEGEDWIKVKFGVYRV